MSIRKTMGKAKNATANSNPMDSRAIETIMNKLKNASVKKAFFDLVEQTKFLTRQDIMKWRNAWQRALSVEYPNRTELHAVYRDVEIDNHLLGVIGQIKNEVLQKAIKIVDRTTKEEIPDLAEQLNDAGWFIDFCEHVIDSVFWGYSLIEFGDVITVNGVKKFSEVDVLDRDYVIPEHHVFIKNLGDHYKNGIDFTQPPYNAWCVGIGKKKDLGLFNKVARHAISKKNMEAFWDKFGEIFGMPIRIGKTNSPNPKDRNDITEMLQKMGSAAWGLFPDGTEIEIKETTRGDAFEVYDKRIERCNSEMSKAVVNQTMTTDNGSSKSQSETHLTIQEKVIQYFAILVRIAINDKLLPIMTMHGFEGWDNARFDFDDTVEYTIDEQLKIEELLLKYYDIKPEHFEKKYNIQVAAKKAKPEPDGGFFA